MLTMSVGLITFIVCFTVGLFFIPIKALLMKPDHAFFFSSSGESFLVSTVAIAVLGISIIILGWPTHKKKMKSILFILTFPISCIGIYYSIDDYYYIDQDGIVIDNLETIQEYELKWGDIDELIHIYRKDITGSPLPSELIIKMKNGQSFEMKLGAREYWVRSSINSTVRKFGGESYIDFYDPEGNFIERKEYF